jgi:pimeloyl-ACP methyl ester carboxylesterase
MPLLSTNDLWEDFGQRALLWAPAGGADFGECLATVEAVGDDGTGDDWYREWTATADRVAGIGDNCAAKGHAASAYEAYLRASTYYRVSYFPLFGTPVDSRLVSGFERDEQTFRKAAKLAPFPLEPVEIETKDGAMPGYLARRDDSGTPRPTIVQTNGYDSNVGEMFFSSAAAALRRGYNWFGFDGPGQGRNLIRDGQLLRPDWEHVVPPVIDFALAHPAVDDKRIVLLGWSLGGYLAPRAAAFEHRIAALVADPGQWDQRDVIVEHLPISDQEKSKFPDIDPSALDAMEVWLRTKGDPMLRWKLLQRGFWVNGADSLFDYFVKMLDYELSPVASQISCPALIAQAEGDSTAAGAKQLYDAITPEKLFVTFTKAEGAGGHCETMARSLFNQRVFDWLDGVLA